MIHLKDIETCEPRSSKRVPPRRIADRQVPVDAGKVTTISIFDSQQEPFIRVVVTNDQDVGGFSDDTEYWYTSGSLAVSGVSSISLESESDEFTEHQLENFIDTFELAFSATQVIGTGGWTQGTYTPTANQARLFKATDPDNSSNQIGMLIEMNGDNELTAVTWYKMSNTGTIFGTTPSSLSFELVMDGETPSTNPNHIASATWYYANMHA